MRGPSTARYTSRRTANGDDGGGAPAAYRFEVRSDDVEEVYRLSVSPPEAETFTVVSVDLGVTVDADRC